MNNIERNALRIAELMGYKATKDNKYFTHTKKQYQRAIDYNELINSFSFYSGLMPIVFECNRSSIKPNVSIHINDVQVWIMQNDEYLIDPLRYINELEFIEALQLAVIKYLELKCGIY